MTTGGINQVTTLARRSQRYTRPACRRSVTDQRGRQPTGSRVVQLALPNLLSVTTFRRRPSRAPASPRPPSFGRDGRSNSSTRLFLCASRTPLRVGILDSRVRKSSYESDTSVRIYFTSTAEIFLAGPASPRRLSAGHLAPLSSREKAKERATAIADLSI